MVLTEYAVRRKVISWMVILLILGGGVVSFLGLGQLEDPEFTIKEAVIATAYPGASPQEVEEEVTLPIENVIQQLPYVENVRSISSAGLSQVTVEMKNIYRKDDLAQIWDEMRRKIRDMEGRLPPGVQDPMINDDFSDVYGVFLAVTGDGYSLDELVDYTDFLKRELVLVDGVGKVAVGGERQEQVALEISRNKLASLSLSYDQLQGIMQNQNMVSDGGHVKVGSEYIRITASGTKDSIQGLKNLVLGRANGNIIYLSDVADVRKIYQDPPTHSYRFNGQEALTLGVSFTTGVNVVDVGHRLRDRLAELEYARPIGMEIHTIYDQPSQVDKSVSDFLISLAEAIAIVVVVLLVAMGLRSGVLMSFVLLLTILATFMGMKIAGIDLHRVSLGALIIALGMLVDNAIVITEGILIGLKRGLSKLEASKSIVNQTVWPLLGATVISVTAFAPIGLSPDDSGEFTGSLFWVLLLSLMISWVLAITITPFLADLMFKENAKAGRQEETEEDPYKGVFYQVYKGLLLTVLRWRWVAVIGLCLSLGGAIYGFKFVSQAFFPSSNLPMITVDYWLPEGSDIRETTKSMAKIEEKMLEDENVVKVTSTIGAGAMRFMLIYAAERNYASYGQFIVEVKEASQLPAVQKRIRTLIAEITPEAFAKSKRFDVGPASKAKIEARLSGPDPVVLRHLAQQVLDIYRNDPDAINIRHDWRERTKVLRPQFAEAQARRLGVTKTDLDQAFALNTTGVQVGLLREGSTLMPIVMRPPADERGTLENLSNIQVYSPSLNKAINIDQVIDRMDLQWEDPLIMRRDRKRTIQVWSDPDPNGQSSSFDLFERLRPQVEAIDLPAGYELEWGGEYEAQRDANEAVFKYVPLGLLVMIAITVLLFNSVRETIVVWLTVPLSVVGMTVGLILLNQPFSFTALLGFLSLSGMVLKNGIVLVEEIKRLNAEEGLEWSNAIVDAAISRLRPVVMAAITTVLGLIPLLTDVFFAPLAVTIMFGLGFATILTLLAVPVFFSLFFRVR